MIIPLEYIKDFHEINEEMVQRAADEIGGENAFRTLLFKANIFRKANTTPMYLMNNEQTLMVVTCKETFGRKLH